MSMSEMLTLRDGQQVPRMTFNTTDSAINALKDGNHLFALLHLARKCNDESYQIPPKLGNCLTTLKDKGLMNETGNIQPDVQKIVRNCINTHGWIVEIVNPLKFKEIISI